jgi:hypothetical protein
MKFDLQIIHSEKLTITYNKIEQLEKIYCNKSIFLSWLAFLWWCKLSNPTPVDSKTVAKGRRLSLGFGSGDLCSKGKGTGDLKVFQRGCQCFAFCREKQGQLFLSQLKSFCRQHWLVTIIPTARTVPNPADPLHKAKDLGCSEPYLRWFTVGVMKCHCLHKYGTGPLSWGNL